MPKPLPPLPPGIVVEDAVNVLGLPLSDCSMQPLTGFFRTGRCDACEQDRGSHTVCAVMTAAFLEFSRARGNDLITPRPEFAFPGLKPGDRWCLCAARFREAWEAGVAPKVSLNATHRRALEVVPLSALKENAVEKVD